MTNGTIFVLNPTATEGSSTRKLSPRPKQMRNLVIGLLDNRKPNANIFMARLEELLKQKFDTVTIVKRQKSSLPVETKDTQNPTDRLLDELAGACHAVINGVGD